MEYMNRGKELKVSKKDNSYNVTSKSTKEFARTYTTLLGIVYTYAGGMFGCALYVAIKGEIWVLGWPGVWPILVSLGLTVGMSIQGVRYLWRLTKL